MKARWLAVPLAVAAVLLVGPAVPVDGGVKVMPLGDSITEGNRITGVSYRTSLWQHLQGGPQVDLVGSERAGNIPDQDHEGHPGLRIDQVRSWIDLWLTLNRPRYVLLHLGTNDVYQAYDLPQAPARLQDLIERIAQRVPGVTILVSSIVPSPDRGLNERITAYNAAIPAVVSAAHATGADVRFVDLNARMAPSDISADTIHPTDAGALKLGDLWYDALSSAMP